MCPVSRGVIQACSSEEVPLYTLSLAKFTALTAQKNVYVYSQLPAHAES